MTTPAVRFERPRAPIIDHLDDRLTQPAGSHFPGEEEVGTRDEPTDGYLQVAWDGTPASDYPVTIRASLRVTAWHWNPTPAEDLALDVLAELGALAGGNQQLWTVKHLTGPLAGQDRDTGYHFASCTFRVSPKPRSVVTP